ncbi:hypothetical protein GCM10011506_26710 [Marivirga lumbricoides]|uniref:Secretion system C-terminal sorting domain-containing protein n=1 Tax=Marivirga lumbricoides TaxID=1046115 RepID=A0ABQ1MGL5_9BACT|nr:hypothetical protein GCM10011506_26710 [Marivirga lumbricoides]
MKKTAFFIPLVFFFIFLSCKEEEVMQDAEAIISEIKVYPNPATEVIYFKLENRLEEAIRFEITDVSGKTELSGQVSFKNSEEQSIEIGHLKGGLYLIYFKLDNAETVKRIIKDDL